MSMDTIDLLKWAADVGTMHREPTRWLIKELAMALKVAENRVKVMEGVKLCSSPSKKP